MGCEEDTNYCSGDDCGIQSSGCDPACESGHACVSGECLAQGVGCSQTGERCVAGRIEAGEFVCMDWGDPGSSGGTCSPNCAADGVCPSGSSCFALRTNQDESCQITADCAAGRTCLSGICRFAACQPSECSGPFIGQAECDEKYGNNYNFINGTRCVAGTNQSNFCNPAGIREVGEACIGQPEATRTQNFMATCAVGLGCVNSTCLQSCSESSDCASPETCVFDVSASSQGASDNTGSSDIGFCVNTCTPFGEESCPDNQMCRPLGDGAGKCVPTGAKAAFSACLPGESQCESGTLCVEYPNSGGQARCQPICDLAAGAPAADGTIPPGAQAARDATCPQPEAAPASLRFANFADSLGAVDIYLDDAADPLVAGLDTGEVHPASASPDASWHEILGGRYRVRALPAGAPRTDLALAEFTIDLSAGQGKIALLAAAGSSDSQEAQFVSIVATPADLRSPTIEFRLAHLVADLGAIDVVLIPANADASDQTQHTLLVENLRHADVAPADAAVFELPTEDVGDSLRLLVFPTGADRSNSAGLVFKSGLFALDEDTTLVLNGTMSTQDTTPTSLLTPLLMGPPAPTSATGARFSCVESDAQGFGFCQQICGGGADDFGQNTCQGQQLGCTPTYLSNRDQWQNLCAPVGAGRIGDGCDPLVESGTCKEGLYCLAVGGSDPNMSALHGRCTPLCDVDAPAAQAPLGCETAQSCQGLAPDTNFKIGRCGWSCDPGSDYRDETCPEGLDRCQPIASTREDLSGQTAPQVRHEQPYCAAAGPRTVGENCFSGGCQAGSECLFPRSIQTDFTSTIASPYFGAVGLSPVCMPQCDPFDGDSAAHTCGPSETCLFNVPWSAEVGHCAPIFEDLAPMQPCNQPGLACGTDSICAINQGAPTCFRFCDYLGADSQGAFFQSTCPGELRCVPLINDIGVCQAF